MAQQPAHEAHLHSIKELKELRNQLLNEIKCSGIDYQTLTEPKADILLQKRRYNHLVDDLIQMETGPFTDPLNSLPIELWIKIIASLNDNSSDGSNPIDQLLTLTCVSKTWSEALLSVPSFWTTVILDGLEEDTFAKAITSLQLSGTLELDVTIIIPPATWREMAPMLVPSRGRIHTLKLQPFYGRKGLSPQDAEYLLQILRSFGQLPVLRNLLVVGPSPSALTLEHMPLLQTVKSLLLSHDTVASLRHSAVRSIRILEFDKRMVETLAELPHLRHLDLHLPYPSPPTDRMPSSILRLPVKSIHIKRPTFYPVDSIFGCLGLKLQRITITYVELASFFDTLASLQQFRHLRYVSLYVIQNHPPSGDPPDSSASYYLPSVKSLSLTFGYGLSSAGWPIPWINAVGCSIVATFPSTERLVCKESATPGTLIPYIRKLTKLRSLVVECDPTTTEEPPSSLVGEHLKHLNWTGSLPTRFFDYFRCSFLHTLHLITKYRVRERTPLDSSNVPEISFLLQKCRIPLIVTSNVTLLSLTMRDPALWDLASFPALKRVHFGPSIWVSDFFEQLLLRPNDCPNLEHITIEGKYYEWDILLLMLERRVFAAKSGVASIKSITFNRDLPFTLLHAISELLRGKFLISTQISEFSLEAVGHRMFDSSRPGCTRCCQEFRNCDLPTEPKATHNPFDYWGLAWDYDLPFKLLSPDPALTLEMEDWIARKRERRVNYTSKYQNAQFQRIPDCARGDSSCSGVVTAHSMVFE